jgi:hypothetical protein
VCENARKTTHFCHNVATIKFVFFHLMNYFQKTQQLLDFGVEKVIWLTTNWTTAIEIINGISSNLLEIVP